MGIHHSDVVTIRFFRDARGRRIINRVTIIGSARPCRSLLVIGFLLLPAVRCLIRHRFRIVLRTPGLWVLRRIH
ncbi:hypothetical protein WMW72_15705 [Paenibacillus filicis]|uniref:Uncharacterized protein n=1 Tax=Paenibacillus filicis TaxID=669464 RepID=A0ABU9DKG0_9BACL